MTSMTMKRIGGAIVVAAVAAVSYAAGVAQGKAVNMPLASLKWAPAAPGSPIQIAVLWGDRDKGPEYGMLLKLPAGSEAGVHAHTADYHAVNVQGTLGAHEPGRSQTDTSSRPGPTWCSRARRCTTTCARARPTASSSSTSTRLEISFRGSSPGRAGRKVCGAPVCDPDDSFASILGCGRAEGRPHVG